MANRRLKRMEISQECAEALEKHHLEFAKVGLGLSPSTRLPRSSSASLRPPSCRPADLFSCCVCQDVMGKNKQELVSLLGLHEPECEQLLQRVAQSICPIPRSVSDAIRAKHDDVRFMPTGMAAFDATLRGGLPCGGITEVVGPAGAGKTQFCLQNCVSAIGEWVEMEYSAIYIDTVLRPALLPHCCVCPSQFPHPSTQPKVYQNHRYCTPDAPMCCRSLASALSGFARLLVTASPVFLP